VPSRQPLCESFARPMGRRPSAWGAAAAAAVAPGCPVRWGVLIYETAEMKTGGGAAGIVLMVVGWIVARVVSSVRLSVCPSVRARIAPHPEGAAAFAWIALKVRTVECTNPSAPGMLGAEGGC
jgi:hypothetical protein